MTLRLFGTTFSRDAADEVIAAVAAQPRSRPRLVVTANVDHIVILSENAAFRKAYDGAAMRTLDGVPLVWLARLTGARRVRRVTGHDLLAAALSAPPHPDCRVFLVCSHATVGERVAARFVDHGLVASAVLFEVPPLGFEHDEVFGASLVNRIREHRTSLLVMGVGAPKSEIWVDRHGAELGNPIVLAVGEALNVAAGIVPRAPIVMQRLGLEWLFRFLHAPRRLFRRYFMRSWRFFWILAMTRAREPLGKSADGQALHRGWLLPTETKPK